MANIKRYLRTKDKTEYTNLDRLFEMQLNGKLKSILKSKSFSNINLFLNTSKNNKSMQISFNYCNLGATCEFNDDGYDYGIYVLGCTAEEFERSIIKVAYEDDFNFELFVEFLSKQIENDNRLNPKKQNSSLMLKTIKIIRFFCFSIPCLFILISSLYVIIAKETLYLGPWLVVVLCVFILMYFVLGKFTKK